MTSFPAVDVAIGLSFVFFLLSVLSTTITETLARVMKTRAKTLESWLKAVFDDPASAVNHYENFLATPIVKALTATVSTSVPGRRAGEANELRPPSYIPSPHFVAGALSAGREGVRVATGAEAVWKSIGDDLERLKGTTVGNSLLEVYARAGGDVVRFRQDAQAWFDDHMERLSGVYRRWSQYVVWITGALMVLALNANTFRIAETLWNDPSKRAAIVAQAGAATQTATDANGDINKLPLPLGWATGYHGAGWLWALVGMALTLGAVSLGAPFWFDTLSRFARIRQTGTPPPASNATRGGEGDQQRQLGNVDDWKPTDRPDTPQIGAGSSASDSGPSSDASAPTAPGSESATPESAATPATPGQGRHRSARSRPQEPSEPEAGTPQSGPATPNPDPGTTKTQ
jgi:hypothetical protein